MDLPYQLVYFADQRISARVGSLKTALLNIKKAHDATQSTSGVVVHDEATTALLVDECIDTVVDARLMLDRTYGPYAQNPDVGPRLKATSDSLAALHAALLHTHGWLTNEYYRVKRGHSTAAATTTTRWGFRRSPSGAPGCKG